MQEDHTPSTFKIGGDDEEPDTVIQNELQELKIEKLSQRVMLLTILIPCMIGVIIIISYLDIKGRVARTMDSGAIGVQKLSKDLESKFSSLSLEQARLKEVQAKKLPLLEKNSAFLKTRLKKVQDTVKNLESTKIERDELSRVVETMNEKYATVPETLQNDINNFRLADDELRIADEELLTANDNLTVQLNQMTEAVNQMSEKLTRMQDEITSTSATKIDKNELELVLKLKEIGHRQEMLEATNALEKKIKSLQSQIDSLKKAQAKPAPAQPKPVQTETTPATPKPAPETIEEQIIE